MTDRDKFNFVDRMFQPRVSINNLSRVSIVLSLNYFENFSYFVYRIFVLKQTKYTYLVTVFY